LSSDDEEYLTPKNLAKTIPRQKDCVSRLLTITRLFFYSPPEPPQNWEQINPNLNDTHSDLVEIDSTFFIVDINNCWRQPEETHSMYAEFSNASGTRFFIIQHGVVVEANFCLRRDVIVWGLSKCRGEIVCEKAVAK
jgi:hypothetical protein